MLNFIKNKDAIWETDKYDVVLVGTSIYCMLSNGFQSKLRLKYPYIEDANNSTNYGDLRKLGKRLTVQGKPVISLLYIAKYPHSKREFVDYDALEHSLATANDRERVLNIMERNTHNMNVDVYDYLQLEKRKEIRLYFNKIKAFENNEPEKYKQLWPIRKELIKDLYLEF